MKKKKKKKEEAGKKMELAKVIAPYDATSKEQLTLTKGQMIMVKKRTETGWWQGEIQGGVSSWRCMCSTYRFLESPNGPSYTGKPSVNMTL